MKYTFYLKRVTLLLTLLFFSYLVLCFLFKNITEGVDDTLEKKNVTEQAKQTKDDTDTKDTPVKDDRDNKIDELKEKILALQDELDTLESSKMSDQLNENL
jgi:hypothetical protein|tara:strand:+ start:8023 stop:8325 length:303 start_codon:yes stop_codon:yes gene_type:complete